ncbi:MAG: hypothetical protein ACJ0HU_03440 [Gammaproteobacteria bacterium]
MKYLLSILILFSGLSFSDAPPEVSKEKILYNENLESLRFLQSLNTETETYNTFLTCDTSYLFYPSIEERWLIVFNDPPDETGLLFYYSPILELAEAETTLMVFTTDILFKANYSIPKIGTVTLNRTTLELSNDMQCKKVSKEEYIDAKSNLAEYAEEQRAKRKI